MIDRTKFKNFTEDKKIEIEYDFINKDTLYIYYIEELAKNNKALKEDKKIFYTEISNKTFEDFKEMNIDTKLLDMCELSKGIFQIWFQNGNNYMNIDEFLEKIDEIPMEIKILGKDDNVIYKHKNYLDC